MEISHRKRNVVAAWSEMFGEAAVDWNPVEQDGQLGPPEWSGVDGHSPRRSGAKFLIRIGWIREGVAFLGRWGSDAIFAYIEEVTMVNEVFGLEGRNRDGEAAGVEPPAAIKQAESDDDAQADDLREEMNAASAEFVRLDSLVRALEARVVGQESSLTSVQGQMADLPHVAEGRLRDSVITAPEFVWAAGNGEPYHAIASAHPMMGPEHHITRCGWAFGIIIGLHRARFPPEGVEPCKSCWPELRKRREAKRPRVGAAPMAVGVV
jgi:hypothetical protein